MSSLDPSEQNDYNRLVQSFFEVNIQKGLSEKEALNKAQDLALVVIETTRQTIDQQLDSLSLNRQPIRRKKKVDEIDNVLIQNMNKMSIKGNRYKPY